MSDIRRTISLREVADRLGVSLDTLYRRKKALRETGFPEHLPGFPGRYDPAAIAAWQDRHIPREAGLIADAANDDGDLAAARARMDARAAAPPP